MHEGNASSGYLRRAFLVMAWLSQEFAENVVATVVDFSSILFAYNLGLHQFGTGFGLAYAAFDAYVVIWLRRPLTRGIRRFLKLFQRNVRRDEVAREAVSMISLRSTRLEREGENR